MTNTCGSVPPFSLSLSTQVKDRFCSLLSDQVASLQDRLRQMSISETPDASEPPSQPVRQ